MDIGSMRDFYQLANEVELFHQRVVFPILSAIGNFWTDFAEFKKLKGSYLLENDCAW
jgi:hypothetical protein